MNRYHFHEGGVEGEAWVACRGQVCAAGARPARCDGAGVRAAGVHSNRCTPTIVIYQHQENMEITRYMKADAVCCCEGEKDERFLTAHSYLNTCGSIYETGV